MEIKEEVTAQVLPAQKGRVYGDSWSHRLKAKIRRGRIARMSGRRSGKHTRPW